MAIFTPQPPTMLAMYLEIEIWARLPIIFEILGERKLTPAQWQKIEEKHQMNKKNRQFNFLQNSRTLFETNLYDIIDMMTKKKDRNAFKFFDMVKRALEELCDAMPIEARYQLQNTIYGMLVEFDRTHRNYIGELLVLNNLVKQQQFELVQTESPMTKSTSADFLVKNKQTGNTELVEVINIHIDKPRNDMKRFIEGKLKDKLAAKTKKAETYERFALVPVIWADFKILRLIEKMYADGGGIDLPFALQPCAFAMFDDDKSPAHYYFKFGSIPTLFSSIPTLFKGLIIKEEV